VYGVVPAAGEGTRLRPLTDSRPKGLVPVGGKPLLTHVFDRLIEAGVDELLAVVGYEKAAIVEHYGDAFRGHPITYVHQRERRGLGHAVLQAAPHVDEPFVLLNGDNVFGCDVSPAVRRTSADGVDAAVVVADATPEEAATTGVLEATDGRVTGVVEKPDDPPSTLVTTGCYVLPPAVFDACRLVRPGDTGEIELTAALDLLVTAGLTVEPVRLDGPRVNVNTPADVERAESLIGSADDE